jgi:DNA-binding NarL/FixJ family response regulator
MRRAYSPRRKIRILVADREGVFRLGLRKLFGVEEDLRVVAEAESGTQALALAESFKPSLFFAQAEILTEGGRDLLAELHRVVPRSKIVVTASAPDESEALRFVRAGASGVIGRSVDPALFVKCARKVTDNELWLPKRQVAEMAKILETNPERPHRPADTLTRREKTIVSYLMQGWRNRDIAQHLAISEQTVKNHLRMVYDKVGVSDRLELVLYVIHHRLDLSSIQPAEGSP